MEELINNSTAGYSFQINFSRLASTPWLSARPHAHKYIQFDLPVWRNIIDKKRGEKLIDFVSGFRSGEYIAKKNYTNEESNYVYLSVGCFSGEEINLESGNYLNEDTGEEYKSLSVDKGDLIVTRSGTVGSWHLFYSPDDRHYIPSHHLSVTRIPNENIRLFLKYYLNSRHILPYVQAYSTGKSQKEINNWSIKRIPIPTDIDFYSIDLQIEKIEEEIKYVRRNIESLQNIIDDILIENGIKKDRFEMLAQEAFRNTFSDISKNSFLRMGAQYHAFYTVHNSLLFDSIIKDVPMKKLGSVIKPTKSSILKKGVHDEEYILLDLEHLEAKSGKIKVEDNCVTEIGSDKVVFGEADIVISKIDPYLAYIFLNDKSKKYIGSTELLPYTLIDEDVDIMYLKYILLSYDYIYKSGLLMYGKRHPRIHQMDLLAFQIPVPKKNVQEMVVSQIKERDSKSDRYQEEIKQLRMRIDDIIYKALK